MILKYYSKTVLVMLAAASIALTGCGSKKNDMAFDSHVVKAEETSQGEKGQMTTPPSELVAGSADAVSLAANSVYFAFDSADVDEAGKAILREHALWMQGNPSVRITVEGNCDERGSREYNLALGDERAKTIRRFLIEHGVAAERIEVVSFGEELPVCSGSGEACWAQNRHGDLVKR